MSNISIIERIKMETKGIELTDSEISIYLQENGVTDPVAEYNPSSLTSKKAIYLTALGILQSIANNPEFFANHKLDDQTIENFSESLNSRISQLQRTIRSMKTDQNSDIFMLFK